MRISLRLPGHDQGICEMMSQSAAASLPVSARGRFSARVRFGDSFAGKGPTRHSATSRRPGNSPYRYFQEERTCRYQGELIAENS